ncbi:hypothetical protein ACHAPE_009670 [Trichoderma viride]
MVSLAGRNADTPGWGDQVANNAKFTAPVFCFFITHLASGKKYIFDLGMRTDLDNSPPMVKKTMLPNFDCYPKSPAKILLEQSDTAFHPSSVKAIIFSHLHFDHIGDAGKSGFEQAELWVGPTSMSKARPGYPLDENSSIWSRDFPTDGSKKIVELTIPESRPVSQRKTQTTAGLEKEAESLYKSVERRTPSSGWFALATFERACDLFDDGSVYAIDAPGHMPGHIMLLVRVKIQDTEGPDDFVLLSGDCFHHSALLRDPQLTARPPFSRRTMHEDPDQAFDTIQRTAELAKQPNMWVIGAHDAKVAQAIGTDEKGELLGLTSLQNWRKNGWKGDQGSY